MFKAIIEIDNIDDYERINGHLKTKQELICPFCGSNGIYVDSRIRHDITQHDITTANGVTFKSQAASMKCVDCGMVHPINDKLLNF